MTKVLKTQDIAPTEPENNVLSMIAQVASNPEANPEIMEKLLDMQERVLDRNAKQAFNADFVRCQREMPTIIKTAVNDQTKSVYAKLEVINPILNDHITKYGFGVSFNEEDANQERYVRIAGELIHEEGHSKTYHHDFPFDDAGIAGKKNKTDAHGKASAATYGQRYVLTLMFNLNLVTDDDGNAANSKVVETLTDKEAASIHDILAEFPEDRRKKFLIAANVNAVEEIGRPAYSSLMRILVRAREKL